MDFEVTCFDSCTHVLPLKMHRIGTAFKTDRPDHWTGKPTGEPVMLCLSCLSEERECQSYLQDAFPPSFVKQNRFQRQATLLVYLNDVPTGGTTHFDRLDVSIQPECGKALLFFPAFADGTPDPR